MLNKKELLLKLANNLLWSWKEEIKKIFEELDKDLWENVKHNPVKLLKEIDESKLNDKLDDVEFNKLLEKAEQKYNNYLESDTWFDKQNNDNKNLCIAYFSAEFGLTECLRIYSGGLGVLSGDHLKSSGDLGIPLIGLGLLYSKGYFQQYLDSEGWQKEYYLEEEFNHLPISKILDQDGEPILVNVNINGETIYIQIWKVNIGRTSLYLLDTDLKQNSEYNREITATLYGGDNETRIRQEIVMGIGGVKALNALNIFPNVFHMNEGHSAFLSLERARMLMVKDGVNFDSAKKNLIPSNVFTTHTPVPAGIDVFPKELINKSLKEYYINELHLTENDFMALGNIPGSEKLEAFNMAHLAMNCSHFVNGVSKLHGHVSKDLWAERFLGINKEDIPIGTITNGVHLKSFTAVNIQLLFDKYLNKTWNDDLTDEEGWSQVQKIPSEELWNAHIQNKDSLIDFARQRSDEQIRNKHLELSAENSIKVLNKDALTIGFARRFATYKRATLIFSDLDRLDKILNNPERPVQIIFAGKAHPQDHAGKEFIQAIYKISLDKRFNKNIIFLENYNLEVARHLVSGCDLWLNNPRRPLEASGTSGMKVTTNGGLNFSILDGWWDEAYTPDLGWKIGDRENSFNSEINDEKDINDLYNTLENKIVPLFFERDENNLPLKWMQMVKNSIATLSPFFNTDRMVKEYFNKYYRRL